MSWRPTRHPRRTALSLLEVVLAMAILAGAMVVLTQLVGMGLRAAAAARDLTRAQILAETVVSEIAAGVTAASSVNSMPLELDPGWLASIDIGTTPQEGMIKVHVVIEQQTEGRAARFELTRWMRDPSLPLPVEDEAAEEGSSSSAISSGGMSSRGGGRA